MLDGKYYRLLIVDNEERMCHLLKTYLEKDRLKIDTAFSGEEALKKFQKNRYDVVVTDLKMPGKSGLDVLETIKKQAPETDVLLMTAYATAQTAVEAMKRGAYDYLIKPFDFEEIRLKIDHILHQKNLQAENRGLKKQLQRQEHFEPIVGTSKAMRRVFQLVEKVADTTATVLIRGESGTGKELVARAIHQKSGRHREPFVAVNCAAIPDNLLESELFGYEKGAFTGADKRKPGRFELAGKGTIFLDEIGDLSPVLQAKLLRVLQNRTFERLGGTEPIQTQARVIAATHRNLEAAVQSGTFREDLYYRVNVFPIVLPPLRERREDILLLVKHFLRKFGHPDLKIEPPFLQQLESYRWPGNVRELENIIQRAVILSDGETLRQDNLPPDLGAVSQSKVGFSEIPEEGIQLEEVEKTLIRQALKKANGNKTRAAQLLGITRRKLYSMANRLNIDL